MAVSVNINWQFQAAIVGGPALSTNQPPITIGGYDVVQVTIPAATASFAVGLQPSGGAGEVVFLAALSSTYDTGLKYTVNADTTVRVLDGPHVFLGAGAVGFLIGGAAPQTFTFNNTLTKPVDIQILVGRKVP